jgi:hypothetical protein
MVDLSRSFPGVQAARGTGLGLPRGQNAMIIRTEGIPAS